MSLQLIDAVQSALKADTELMYMLKLTSSSSPDEVVKRFTKGMEPEITVGKDTIPHICQYVMPGRYAVNPLVFEGKFCIDFYGKTAREAKLLFERSFKILHDRRLTAQGFASYLCVLTYDADFATGIQGAKGYKAIFDVDYLRMN
ncbi:hypothetical protein [Paenibacillus polymyxa]|uniref:Uncharacterized protein n=1 Tax=Paenibacillus polymyxa TaxID=1406 RepID=A0ABX2ZCR5_PAEPO|nr:hypothetical protein [Paenibacillus polymyxa]ODA09242.1 hypothetical protein A7312_26665 [Paenibacillus polymyxa]